MIINTTTPVQIGTTGRHTLVQNLGSDEAYVGTTSSITSSTGFQVASGTYVDFDAVGAYGTPVWAVVAAGKSADVRVLAL